MHELESAEKEATEGATKRRPRPLRKQLQRRRPGIGDQSGRFHRGFQGL